MYPGVPPFTFKLIDPLLPPLHDTDVAVAVAVSCVGSVTVALRVIVQPLASVIVTVYVPDVKPVLFCVVAPPFQV